MFSVRWALLGVSKEEERNVSSDQRRHYLLRRLGLALAVAAIAAPSAQAIGFGPYGAPGATRAEAATSVSIPEELSGRLFGPATLPVASPTQITIPEELSGRLFGPANLPVTIPDELSQRQFGPGNLSPLTPGQTVKSDGFDFGDAGMGFGVAAALALLAGAMAMSLRSRGKLAIR